MINTELSFQEVCEQLHFMKANPQYLLSHVTYYFSNWFTCLTHAMEYVEYAMKASEDESTPREEFDNMELSVLKLGFLILPSIAYMEDNEMSYKLYDAICLFMYNFAQVLEDEELLNIFNANMSLSQQYNTIQGLLTVAQSVMIQYQAMNMGNKNSDPYQLSLRYLEALTQEGDPVDAN